VLARLTPSSERGDVIAAGAVVITTFALLFEIRFADSWDAGPRLLVVGALALLVGTLAFLAPLEDAMARPYQSILYITDFVLTLLALGELADVLGAEDPSYAATDDLTWTLAAVAAVALVAALRCNSAICLFLAAVAAAPTLFIKFGGFSQATARALGGTSVLIVVGVAIDTMKQLEAQLLMRNYEGFIKR